MSKNGVKVGVITQARMTSTRLPGKVLLEAAGDTMLGHQIRRLRAAGLDVYLATTMNATDDPIVAVAEAWDVPFHRGSEDDVLSRFIGTIDAYDLDVVVRVTSDCPLIDGAVVAEGVRTYLEADDPDVYVSNTLERSYPRGFDFEVFSADALREAHEKATEPAQREHVTPYLYAHESGRIRTIGVRRNGDASGFRVTLDTPEDWEVIRRLFEEHEAANLDAEAIIAVLEAHPELASINSHVEQKH